MARPRSRLRVTSRTWGSRRTRTSRSSVMFGSTRASRQPIQRPPGRLTRYVWPSPAGAHDAEPAASASQFSASLSTRPIASSAGIPAPIASPGENAGAGAAGRPTWCETSLARSRILRPSTAAGSMPNSAIPPNDAQPTRQTRGKPGQRVLNGPARRGLTMISFPAPASTAARHRHPHGLSAHHEGRLVYASQPGRPAASPGQPRRTEPGPPSAVSTRRTQNQVSRRWPTSAWLAAGSPDH